MDGNDGEVTAFGPFRLCASRRELERDGTPLALGHRALDILIALVERAGEIVSHRELNERVWRNLVVSPGNLRVHMSALRKALGDGEAGARYIENVTGQGYCFVSAISRESAAQAPLRVPQFPEAARKRMVLPPKLERMVGRDEIVDRIAAYVIAERFVTVTGPGGMGKTTVAIAVAHALHEEFAGAVCFVDVGAVADENLVAATIASSLGLAPETADAVPTLLEYCRTQRILLVLDNCEHLIDSMSNLSETLFERTSGVHILATSREALRVEGEHVYWLPPLDSPTPESSLKAMDVRTYPAVRLFLERAGAAGGRFELDDDNAPMIAGICGRLDGIALAIEIAAGRAASHGFAATADLLNRNLGLDWHGRRTALPRHQTLRALLDWSYGLLAEANQRALCQLSVLVGAFSVEAASAVLDANDAATLEILDTLVSKSLVSVQSRADGWARYRVLETTKIYVREKLLASDESSSAARRHAEYFAKLLHSLHGGQIDLEYTGRAHALREHLGNVRAALDWCFSERQVDPALAVDLAAAAAPVFFELSLLSESYKWSEAGLAALDESTRGGRRELILRSTFAISSMWVRGSDDVMSDIARGMELARHEEPAQRLRLQATRHMVQTRMANFRDVLEAAKDWEIAAREVGDTKCLAIADLLMGIARHSLGDQEAARRLFTAGFSRAGDQNLQLCGMDQRVRGTVSWSRTLWLSGFPQRAEQAAREAVDASMRSGKPLNTCFALLFCTPVYLWCGDWDGAQAVLDRLVAHSHWNVLKPFHDTALAMQGATLIGQGEAARGTAMLLGLMNKMDDECLNYLGTFLSCFIAEALIVGGRAADAFGVIRDARRKAARGGERVQLPELLRMQALSLLSIAPVHEARAMRLLERSCRIARRQSALSWELRSATSLARIHARGGRYDDALRLLAPIYSRFTEGFATRDLDAARALLREIETKQGSIASSFMDESFATEARMTPDASAGETKTQTSSSRR
jgi:predicted ATPase/DNA-binding winged helix-turn-helix (wHTH) protein